MILIIPVVPGGGVTIAFSGEGGEGRGGGLLAIVVLNPFVGGRGALL